MTTEAEKLQRIARVVAEREMTAGMDNQYPPGWVEEIGAILEDKDCIECGAYPQWSHFSGVWIMRHYVTCSQREEES